MNRLRSIVLGALVTTAVATPALAQDKADVSVGYQVQHVPDVTMPLGFNFDVSGRIRPSLSLVGQIDWSRKSESVTFAGVTSTATLNLTTFGGGIRWTGSTASLLTPYLHGLIGATHESGSASVSGFGDVFSGSTTDMMFQLGGGVTVPLSGNVSALGQFDYRRIFTEGEGTNAVRFIAGVRWAVK